MVLGVLLRERQGGREVDYFATDVHGRIGGEVCMVWNGATLSRFLQFEGFGILMLTSRMSCFLSES